MTINRDFWINSFILGFLWGDSLRSFFCYQSVMFYVLSLGVVFWMVIFGASLLKDNLIGKFMLVLLAAALTGIIRVSLDLMETGAAGGPATGQARLVAMVAGLPDKKGQLQEAVLSGILSDDLNRMGQTVRLLAQFDRNEPVEYGQKILVEGELPDPDELEEKNRIVLFRGRLDNYLEGARILKKIGSPRRDLWAFIYRLRGIFLGSLSASLAEPSASLISGILIGERGSLPGKVATDFQITGLTHILAISGFNITIIINLVIFLTAGWKKSSRFVCSLLVIVFFVILTGASASVVRAGVMGMMMLLVKVLERRAGIVKIVLISAFLIVMVDPRLLNFDLSFQLSVFATLSLILFSGHFEITFGKSWQKFLWEGISTTLAAQVITLPFLFYYFGRVSLISPLANLLVGPLIPFLMLTGTAVLVTGLILPVLALPFIAVTETAVKLILYLVGCLADLPMAQLEFGKDQIWLVIVYYLGVFMFFRRRIPVPD
jgi:competence protein ComEC